jgi:hypothetical protein
MRLGSFIFGFLSILVLVFFLALLGWGIWPAGRETRLVQLTSMEVIGAESNDPTMQAQDDWQLTLEWPTKLRRGDGDQVKLILSPLELSDASPRSTGAAAAPGSLLSRLDLTGLPYSPPGELSEGLQPGKTARFFWELQPQTEGVYPGRAWLYFRRAPFSGEQDQELISVQPFEIQIVDFLGLGGPAARILGSLGTALGVVLVFFSIIGRSSGTQAAQSAAEEARNA